MQVGNPEHMLTYYNEYEREEKATMPAVPADLGSLGYMETYIKIMNSLHIPIWGDRYGATDARWLHVLQEAGIGCV